jgi:RimJ/RimL family protein N-acetyltransferase
MRHLGFATEIGAAGLRLGFETMGFQEIIAFTEIHNLASPAVMERLGMQFHKIIHAPGLIEGLDGMHGEAPFALCRLDQ